MKSVLTVSSVILAASLLVGCSNDGAQSEPVTVVETITTSRTPETTEADRPSPTLDDSADSTPTAEETQARSEGGFDRSPDNKVIEVSALQSLWVPELCGNQAGNLSGGTLPASLMGPHNG